MGNRTQKTTVPAWLSSPANFFLVVGLLAGILLCIFIPFNAGFDEETHLTRIWDIARKKWIPNQSYVNGTTMVPTELFRLSYQRRYFQTPASDLFSAELFNRKLNPNDFMGIVTRSSYPPLVYLPQALVVNLLWLHADWAVVPVAILSRIAAMLVYIAGTYLAICLLPNGKWVMVALALAPTALFQAATLNGDSITNAASFLFIAMTLHAYSRRPQPLPAWQTLALVGMAFVLSLCKQGAFVLIPLVLLLPPRRFRPKWWFVVLWGGILLAIALMLAWNLLAVPKSGIEDIDGSGMPQLVRAVLANIPDFLRTLLLGSFNGMGKYYVDWVGVYGHWVGAVPGILYWIYPLGLLAALLGEAEESKFSRRGRLFLLGMFIATAMAISLLFSFLYYQPGSTALLKGVQGRYFTPLAPLLFLALVGLARLKPRTALLARVATRTAILLSLAVFAYGLYATYYTYCGTATYTGGICTQPIYKNLDKESTPEFKVDQTSPLSQTIRPVCSSISKLTIYVKSIPPDPSRILRLSLRDSSGQVFASMEVPTSQLKPREYLDMPVNPPTGQAGQVYEFQVEAPDTPPGGGIGVAVSGQRYYQDGRLFVKGDEKGYDLIFRYSCLVYP